MMKQCVMREETSTIYGTWEPAFEDEWHAYVKGWLKGLGADELVQKLFLADCGKTRLYIEEEHGIADFGVSHFEFFPGTHRFLRFVPTVESPCGVYECFLDEGMVKIHLYAVDNLGNHSHNMTLKLELVDQGLLRLTCSFKSGEEYVAHFMRECWKVSCGIATPPGVPSIARAMSQGHSQVGVRKIKKKNIAFKRNSLTSLDEDHMQVDSSVDSLTVNNKISLKSAESKRITRDQDEETATTASYVRWSKSCASAEFDVPVAPPALKRSASHPVMSACKNMILGFSKKDSACSQVQSKTVAQKPRAPPAFITVGSNHR